MKKIIYIGTMFLPDQNALCQRAFSLLKSCEDLGYEPVAIGFSKEIHDCSVQKTEFDGVKCFAMKYPANHWEWFRALYNISPFITVMKEIGLDQIQAVILADYRFLASVRMCLFCKSHGIRFVADVMDWFEWGRSGMDIHQIIGCLDMWLRMFAFYPFVKRKICISSRFEKLYHKTPYMARIPGTVNPALEKWNPTGTYWPGETLDLCFAGQPGKHCEKEKLNWVIRAVCELNQHAERKITFSVAGVSKKEFYANNEELKAFENCREIRFLGRISHKDCLKMVKESSFSVVPRSESKLSQYGFSTKISESLACGTPVLATDTSDTSLYIHNGCNGFVCECNYESLKNAIREINLYSKEKILEMKRICRDENPLTYLKFTEILEEVIL